MPYKAGPNEPTWTLDILAFEQTAANFLMGLSVRSDDARQTLVDGASQSLLNAMTRALFNCVKASP